MTESQLTLGNDLTEDRKTVYDQMKTMKNHIEECHRKSFKTEDPKEDFDVFKQRLLNECDAWVEDQKKRIDDKFSKI